MLWCRECLLSSHHTAAVTFYGVATMPLEATMVCVDNSEWMRNGDFTPTRFEVPPALERPK